MLWPFEYYSPRKAEDVDALLKEHPGATIFAGGTNLVIDMELDLLRPNHVIDVKKVEGLRELKISTDGPSFIGAAVPVNELIGCKCPTWTCVRDAVEMMATYQVRNRATLVGNLCNASPAADMAPPMLVLGTTVNVRKSDGSKRDIPLTDFLTGVKTTALDEDEWVTGLTVEKCSEKTKTRFYKKQRVRGHDLAVINVAGLCCPESKRLRISVGSCAVTPLLFVFDDDYAKANGLADIEKTVLDKIMADISPITDVRGTAEYRRDMVAHFTKRLLKDIYC